MDSSRKWSKWPNEPFGSKFQFEDEILNEIAEWTHHIDERWVSDGSEPDPTWFGDSDQAYHSYRSGSYHTSEYYSLKFKIKEDKLDEIQSALLKTIIKYREESNIYNACARSLADILLLDTTCLGSILISSLSKSSNYDLNNSFIAAQILEFSDVEESALSLIEVLKNPDLNVRLAAIISLGSIGDKTRRSTPALIEVLKDSDSDARLAAIRSLGLIGDKGGTTALIEILKDSDWNARLAAIRSLGTIGDIRSVPPLLHNYSSSMKEYRSKYWSVRKPYIESYENKYTFGIKEEIFNALINTCNKEGTSTFEKALKDDDFDVKDIALDVLIHLDDNRSIPVLTRLLKESKIDVEIRRKVYNRLIKKGRFIPALFEVDLDEIYGFHRSSYFSDSDLESFMNKQTVDILIKAIKSSDFWISRAAKHAIVEEGDKQAVPELIRALKDANADVRSTAVTALGRTGTEQAIPMLIETLLDPDKTVRHQSTIALSQLGAKKTRLSFFESIFFIHRIKALLCIIFVIILLSIIFL